MKQNLPLDDRLDRVAQHIIRARLFFDLWLYFEGAETRPKIIETMRDYNEFFRFTPHACLVTYVIYVASVFDAQKRTISLMHLVPEMKNAGRLKGPSAIAVDDLMALAAPVVAKVRVLRNQAVAHKTAHISYNDVFKLAAVTPDQLGELTDVALQIANKLLRTSKLNEQHFTRLPREAAEQMMTTLSGSV